MYFIDMYDKVMCAVVASASVCITGWRVIRVSRPRTFLGFEPTFVRSRAAVYLNHRAYAISYY